MVIHLIACIDEAVMEAPRSLMRPQLCHRVLALAATCLHLENPLEYFGDITEVEGVVASSRGGEQVGDDGLIELNRGLAMAW